MKSDAIAHLISTARDRIDRYLVRELEKSAVKGLVPSHGAILFHLFAEGEMTMKKLAEAVQRDKSTVTVLVDKLVRHGYVEKCAAADDQRYTYVRLTDAGKTLEPAFRQISNNLLATIWQGISEDEQKKAVEILNRICNNL